MPASVSLYQTRTKLDNHMNVLTSMFQVTMKFKPPQLMDFVV